MKRLLFISVLALSFCSYSLAQCGEKCGVVRWAVKTLSDTTVPNVNFKPKKKTVKWQVNQTPADTKPKDTRINGLEWINFRVEGVLVGYKLSSQYLTDMNEARESFRTSPSVVKNGKVTGTFKRPDKRVIVGVIGIGLWDHIQGQIGVAKSGIELHPVIWFRELP